MKSAEELAHMLNPRKIEDTACKLIGALVRPIQDAIPMQIPELISQLEKANGVWERVVEIRPDCELSLDGLRGFVKAEWPTAYELWENSNRARQDVPQRRRCS